jgi:hypothetical protein
MLIPRQLVGGFVGWFHGIGGRQKGGRLDFIHYMLGDILLACALKWTLPSLE